MAVLVRTRRVVNPGHRRKRRVNAGKKRMTLKQKLHFGTARQRAAARLSLHGRRANPSIRKTKKSFGKHTISGAKKRGKNSPLRYSTLAGRGLRKATRRKRRKNVGEIVSISLAGLNPGRKRRKNTGMAKSRKRVLAGKKAARTRKRRHSNPGVPRRRRYSRHRASNPRRRHRRNPGKVYAMRRINRGRRRVSHRRYHRRGNPGIGGVTTGLIGKVLWAAVGAIGSKYATQLALAGNNTGYMGYAGNLVATIGLSILVGKAAPVANKKEAGQMVLLGGVLGLTLRVLQDMTPIGQYVNLSLSGVGKGGDLGLGIIQDSSFPVPQTFAPGSMTNAVVPRATRSYVSAQTAQMAVASTGKSGMGRMMGRPSRRAVM